MLLWGYTASQVRVWKDLNLDGGNRDTSIRPWSRSAEEPVESIHWYTAHSSPGEAAAISMSEGKIDERKELAEITTSEYPASENLD